MSESILDKSEKMLVRDGENIFKKLIGDDYERGMSFGTVGIFYFIIYAIGDCFM